MVGTKLVQNLKDGLTFQISKKTLCADESSLGVTIENQYQMCNNMEQSDNTTKRSCCLWYSVLIKSKERETKKEKLTFRENVKYLRSEKRLVKFVKVEIQIISFEGTLAEVSEKEKDRLRHFVMKASIKRCRNKFIGKLKRSYWNHS